MSLNFDAPNDISGTVEARIVKFCMKVDRMKSQPTVTNHPQKGLGQIRVTRFYVRGASYARVLAVFVCLYVCLSVCHTPV